MTGRTMNPIDNTMLHDAPTRRTDAKFLAAATFLPLMAAAALLSFSSGCQVALNGQTLPSPYYLQDDVQYFPAGPEFKLPREAAALQAARAEEKLNQR